MLINLCKPKFFLRFVFLFFLFNCFLTLRKLIYKVKKY
ncbi:hypothetical protein NT07LI_3231, partial [Listeria innocua FSL S4-378]